MLRQAKSEETASFWNDVDPSVTGDLNDQQKTAINDAVSRRSNDRHAADIRLSAFGYFLVVLCGKERRNTQRLKQERQNRPVVTFNNLLMLAVLWGSVIFTLYSLLPLAMKFILKLIL
ncbi:hypothetical protein LP7551_03043 [Roseibium album]|nr:hypothetical protein LP7551_03043 [Roseibium album]